MRETASLKVSIRKMTLIRFGQSNRMSDNSPTHILSPLSRDIIQTGRNQNGGQGQNTDLKGLLFRYNLLQSSVQTQLLRKT